MLTLLNSISPFTSTSKPVPETTGTKPKTCFFSSVKHYPSLSLRRHVCAAPVTTQDTVSSENVASFIHDLEKEKKIDVEKLLHAFQLWVEMANKTQKPSPSLARSLLYLLTSRGLLRKAVRVAELLLRRGVVLDQVTCTFIIGTLVNKGAYEYAIKLLDDMRQTCCPIDRNVYHTLTTSLCKHAFGGSVWHHLEKLIQKGYVPITKEALHNMLEAARLQRGADAAVYVLYQFMSRGVEPNITCYNNLLSAFKKEKWASEALELLWALPPGIQCNLVTYNILLNMLGDQGRWRETVAVLDSMMESGILPNMVTYKILISVLSNNGYADEAMQVAETLGRNGFRTDEWCFNPIIARFCSEHRLDMVYKCLESMERWNCPLKEGTYKAITVLCKEGMADEAFDILQSLCKKKGSTVHLFYGKLALPYLCRKGSTIEALQILNKLVQVGYTPNSEMLYCLVIGLCLEGLHEEALNLFEVTDKYHIQPNANNYKILISRLCKGGRADLAILALEKMVMKGCEPSKGMYVDIIEGIGCQGRKDLVVELLRELNAQGLVSQENIERISVRLCLDDAVF